MDKKERKEKVEDIKNKIIDCKKISDKIRDEIKEEILQKNIKLTLAVILVGDDKASKTYVKNKEKACEYVGIKTINYILEENISEIELLELIEKLNSDNNINGILVQLPLPKHINKEIIIKAIDVNKDVDCFHPYNIGLIDKENSIFKPCTPQGCIEILKRNNIEIQGKNCVVIGRSDIVGKPMANLLLKENGTITIVHSKTKNLEEITKQADIIIVAIGKAKFLKANMIKKGVVIIDVGINRDENNNLCGDVDFENCLDKVSYITPVPKGVGLLTVSILIRNTLNACYKQNNIL